MKHLLRITSIVIGVAGAALGFISNAVDNKRQEIKIREEVDRRFEERFERRKRGGVLTGSSFLF